jgi:hypothetical protein
VCETYLIHALIPVVGNRAVPDLLNVCGWIKFLVRDCGPPPDLIVGTDITEANINDRNGKIIRLQIFKSALPLQDLENIPLLCEHDVFFETLLINVKNEVISHQSFMRKTKYAKIEHLKKVLDKQQYTGNTGE